MALSDYKLKFQIDGETRDIDQALDHVYGRMNNIGGAGTAAFGGFIPVAGAAAAAIAGIGIAVAGVSVALFQMSKAASDFGSEIFDASEKTGLGAEALSALKAAAETSGSSLESVTKGIAKFAKEYKGPSGDLQAELAKVMKQVADAKPGFEQLQIAQKNFGKSGGDLIPVIKSFNGDLDDLIMKMTDLGVTITDEAAMQADAFGDQMDILGMQISGVGRTIGTAFMPQFMAMAGSVSKWLVENKDEVSEFAGRSAKAFENIILGMSAVKDWIVRNQSYLRIAAGVLTMGKSEALIAGGKWMYEQTTPDPVNGAEGAGRGVAIPDFDYDATGARPGKVKNDAEQQAREEEARQRKAFGDRSDELQRKFNEDVSWRNRMLQQLEQDLAKGLTTEKDYAARSIDTARQTSEAKIKLLEDLLVAAQKYGQATAEIESRLKIARDDEGNRAVQVEIETWKAYTKAKVDHEKAAEKLGETQRRIHESLREMNREQNQWLEDMRKQREADEAEAERKRVRAIVDQNENAVSRGAGLGGGIARGMGVTLPGLYNDKDELLSQADFLKGVYGDVADFAGNAIGSMIQGLSDMALAWLMTGEFSGQAALKMLASAALSIATQAGFKAIFEVAEGMAALARYDPASATLHFAAAKTYGVVAAVAGGAGVALALGARAMGGSSSGGGSGASSGTAYSNNNNQNNDPYRRASATAYDSGTRTGVTQLATAVRALEQKIGGMSAGDVLVAGSKQKRGFIATQTVNDLNSGVVSGAKLGKAMGMR